MERTNEQKIKQRITQHTHRMIETERMRHSRKCVATTSVRVLNAIERAEVQHTELKHWIRPTTDSHTQFVCLCTIYTKRSTKANAKPAKNKVQNKTKHTKIPKEKMKKNTCTREETAMNARRRLQQRKGKMKQREWSERTNEANGIYNNISQTNKHETIQLTTFYENKRVKKKMFHEGKKSSTEKKLQMIKQNEMSSNTTLVAFWLHFGMGCWRFGAFFEK